MIRRIEGGFSAVELMVTLFVAALFILSGLQLYGVVVTRLTETRQLSEASNIGYEVLRNEGSEYKPSSVTPCTASATPTAVNRPSSLPDLAISIERCKPFADAETIVEVRVKVSYGTPKQEVVHATYISGF